MTCAVGAAGPAGRTRDERGPSDALARAARARSRATPGWWAAASATRSLGRPVGRTSTWPSPATPRPPPATLCRAHGGTRFRLSRAFGAWRVQGGDLPFQIDITPLQGANLAEDLGRRDLTVNALALPVAAGGARSSTATAAWPTSRRAACGW